MQSNILEINENRKYKIGSSSDYNFIFNKDNGFFARWGKTYEEDPSFSPYGPELLDLEISTGKCSGKCPFCYKGNGEDINTHHMTFEEFKIIFHKMPATLTQIAFGICDIDSNPEFFKMMRYARQHEVIPNYTCNGLRITDDIARKTAEICGAVAVSIVNKQKTFEAVRKFIAYGMKQTNIHFMLSNETYDEAFEIVDILASDPSLQGFNAIVFLQYKPKGKNTDLYSSVVDVNKYRKLVNYCKLKQVNFGFDSCSANIFVSSVDKEEKDLMETISEPCESGLFSSYINCRGQFFVCSFAEGEDQWIEGIDVPTCKDFLQDVWFHPRVIDWRKRLIENGRNCPIFDLKASTQNIKTFSY
jgi:MoaA/NifB/PqqE/SkfB family radical SAM enzyme